MRSAALLVLSIATVLASGSSAAAMVVEHRALGCWPTDRFPLVSARISAPSSARSVKVYYRAIEHPDFFFVESKRRSDGTMEVAMPMASTETKEVVYFIEALGHAYEVERTPAVTVPVMESRDCDGDDEDGLWFRGADPEIPVRPVQAGAPRMPPGFQAAGLTTREASRKILVGVLAGVGVAGGFVWARDGSPSGPRGEPTTPGGGTGAASTTTSVAASTTSAPASTTSTPPSTTSTPSSTTTTTAPATPRADIRVALDDSPDPVPVATGVTYRLTVSNDGPQTATGVTAVVQFALGVTLNSAPSSCSGLVGNRVDCDLGTIAAGDSASVDLVVASLVPGTITVEASASANEPDPNTSNNTATQTTTVTLSQRAWKSEEATIRSVIVVEGIEVSVRAVVTAGGRAFELENGAPVTMTMPVSESSWVEATAHSTGESSGWWRFDVDNAFGATRFEVEAGQPISVEPSAIVFRVEEGSRIRFRFAP